MRILLVDDDPMVVEGLERRLQQELDDAEIWCALSAEQGLELMEAHDGEFDLVVTDLQKGALDLLHECYRRWPRTVRVLLSGRKDPAAARSFSPAHLVLAKPCEAAELMRVVDRARTWRAILTRGPDPGTPVGALTTR